MVSIGRLRIWGFMQLLMKSLSIDGASNEYDSKHITLDDLEVKHSIVGLGA